MVDETKPNRWKRSSTCQQQNCVEVAPAAFSDDILIRSSTNPGLVLRVTAAEWAEFQAGMINGDFA